MHEYAIWNDEKKMFAGCQNEGELFLSFHNKMPTIGLGINLVSLGF